MKNKIFELYKPESLREFLDFYKNNPEEKFVYVAQQPPAHINILSASDFGYLVLCLPNYGPDSQVIYSMAPFNRKMKKNLQNFRQQDYILAIGDPIMIGISFEAIHDVTNGKFNVLKWNNKEKRYFPLDQNFYNKGEDDGR
jgi:hypothetical protein